MAKGINQLVADLSMCPAFNLVERERLIAIIEILTRRIGNLEDELDKLKERDSFRITS